MKKLFLMLAIAGMVAFGACKADEETQKKQQEANDPAKVQQEAGEMPEFDEQGNPIEKKKDDASATTPADTSKKQVEVKDEKKGDEAKKDMNKKDEKKPEGGKTEKP
ncbi:hypothetical protein [Raineya orbicola]|jgi:hypothetical protein|nr:hypothetical protein [Raineya orbicola]